MQSVYKVSEPTSRELSAWVEPFYTVSEPTSRGLSAGSAACFTCSEPTSSDCLLGVQSVYTVSKPSSSGLSAGKGYRLFIRLKTYFYWSNSWVQSVYKVSEPTSMKLCLCQACLYGVRTYLQGIVSRECSLKVFVKNLHLGNFCLGCIPFCCFQTFLQVTVGQRL